MQKKMQRMQWRESSRAAKGAAKDHAVCCVCVVKGPLANLRNTPNETETEFTVASDDTLSTSGTPVVCDSLKLSSHLNGKIGDVRAYKRDMNRYEVHFEDKELEPCLVKRGNIRILSELTDEL